MWKYAALISYNGARFCGWQKQKGSAAAGAPSIQETIETTLIQMVNEDRVSSVGSGRTDAGVHAAGQVMHFTLRRKEWDPAILQKGLNSLLPHSIRLLAVRQVPIEFHAQRSAEKKQYSYYFQQGPCAIPHLAPFSWWIRKRLDVEAMAQAARDLIGEHDFKAFQSRGAKPGPTVRRILEAEVSFEPVSFPGSALYGPPIGLVRFRVVGTGFLKQMVRSIAGTLLQVGEGKRDSGCIREILERQSRDLTGPTAQPRGLWLEQVWYPGLEWY